MDQYIDHQPDSQFSVSGALMGKLTKKALKISIRTTDGRHRTETILKVFHAIQNRYIQIHGYLKFFICTKVLFS